MHPTGLDYWSRIEWIWWKSAATQSNCSFLLHRSTFFTCHSHRNLFVRLHVPNICLNSRLSQRTYTWGSADDLLRLFTVVSQFGFAKYDCNRFHQPFEWIGPPITPLTGNNAGWRVYEVDAKTFSVVGAQTYLANVSASNTWTTAQWEFEYDTRAVYDPQSKWGKNDPLNATFWNNVTAQMLNNVTWLKRIISWKQRYGLIERQPLISLAISHYQELF